jgi:predicted RND superfamily exporter protein
VLAFLVGARMLSNAVQITHRYIEEFRSSGDKQEAAQKTMQAMMMPNAAAVATDAAGFLVLALAKIVLMMHLAIMMSFWMLTIVLEGMLVPIICSYLPLRLDKLKVNTDDEQGFLSRLNAAVAGFSITSGKYVVGIVVVAILLVGTWQTTHLKVGDPTPGSPILWPDHTYNQDQALMNEKFKASSENFVLYYEGDTESVYDPIVLKTFENFAQHMAERLPDIYKSSSSIIDMGKMLNLTFHDGDQMWYQLPRNEEQLTGLLGYIRNTVGAGVLSRFLDRELERSQITLFFADHTSDNMLRIREAAYDFFKDHPAKVEKGEFKLAGGRIGMEIGLNEEMKRSHAVMDTLVLVAIFIMCSFAFRSLVAGAMLTGPLILSNLIAFSYMAATNIGLSVNTLPCSAVGVGVGVDFAIYLYSRCIEEFPHRDGWADTIMTAVRTAGKGIVFTGLTLILPILTWYFISALKFQAQMGFFLSMLLFTNMIAAFTIHPLLIWIVKPKFMKRGVTEVGSS